MRGFRSAKKVPCRYCGCPISSRSITLHEDICASLPTNDGIIGHFRSGWSQRQIADHYGVNQSSMHYMLKRRGICAADYVQCRTTVDCPRCGASIDTRLFQIHWEICSRIPDKQELTDLLLEGWSVVQLARHFDIGDGTMGRILRRMGINSRDLKRRAKQAGKSRDRLESIDDADLDHLAPPDDVLCPEYGGWKTCKNCKHEDQCRRRSAAGLWVLCERPTREHVALAYIRGEFGSDGYMPEWLIVSLQELGYEKERG